MWWHHIQGLIGLLFIPCLAWLVSENRGAARPRMVILGIASQLVLALLLLKLPPFQEIFLLLNQAVLAVGQATQAGTAFVFGYLGGAKLPFVERTPGSSLVLAFQVLPLVLVISALASLLFYWQILPLLVQVLAWGLRRTLGIGGALGLAAAASVFVGMIEAPLLIRPYLRTMSRGELFAVMTVGMATIAGTVMFLYAQMLAHVIPNTLGNILTASIVNVPAALIIADLMVPLGKLSTDGDLATLQPARSSMDAITRGTLDGLSLLLNIIAMLVVLVAIVNLANQIIGLLPAVAGQALTMQTILGWLMAPMMWLIGIPWAEAHAAARSWVQRSCLTN